MFAVPNVCLFLIHVNLCAGVLEEKCRGMAPLLSERRTVKTMRISLTRLSIDLTKDTSFCQGKLDIEKLTSKLAKCVVVTLIEQIYRNRTGLLLLNSPFDVMDQKIMR